MSLKCCSFDNSKNTRYMSLKATFSRVLGLENIKYALTGLIEAKLELKKIEFQEWLGTQLTNLIFWLIAAILSFILLIMASVLIAIGINSWLDSDWYGFAIITGIYLLLLILWMSNEQKAKRRIEDRVTKEVDEKMKNLKMPI